MAFGQSQYMQQPKRPININWHPFLRDGGQWPTDDDRVEWVISYLFSDKTMKKSLCNNYHLWMSSGGTRKYGLIKSRSTTAIMDCGISQIRHPRLFALPPTPVYVDRVQYVALVR